MTPTPFKNPSPAQRFRLSSDNISKHRDLIDSPVYQRAIDFGLMQYSAMLSQQATEGNSAMAVGFKLQGAMEFLMTVRMLSEEIQAPKIIPAKNLDHTLQ